MKQCCFPQGSLLFNPKPFSREVFEITLDEIYNARDRFTGYMKIEKADEYQLFLFFLKGAVYAAGVSTDCMHKDTSIRDFFDRLSVETNAPLTLSLHETDPVLLKEMLIILQREPTTRAMTNLIDLEDISKKIQGEVADALIVLNKHNRYNFFFFKDGKGVMSHLSDTDFNGMEDAPVIEQVLSYGYPADLSPVEAFIYRNISTAPADDSESLSKEELIMMLHEIEDIESPSVPHVIVRDNQKNAIRLVIVEGHHKGSSMSATIPCVIGRKQADIHIKDRHISRRHAHIIELECKFFIEDLDSTNGTYVNDEEIKVRELRKGDTITVGETTMKIEGIGRS
jgi:hypothetical protein